MLIFRVRPTLGNSTTFFDRIFGAYDPEGVRGSMMAGGRLGPEGDFPLGGMHRLETRTRATDRDDDLNEML